MIQWAIIGPGSLTGVHLLAEYCARTAEAGNPREDALAVEMERRHLDA